MNLPSVSEHLFWNISVLGGLGKKPTAKCAALLGTDSDTFITRTILRLSFAYGLPAGRRCIFTTLEVLTNWVASELTEFPLRYHSPASFADDVDG